MECPELPGFRVDVAAMLRGLGSEDLVLAVKAAVRPRLKAPARGGGPCVRGRGVVVDVPELLRSLPRRELLVAVRAAVEPWPAVKQQLVQELMEIAGASDSGSPQDRAASPESGVRLPQLVGSGSSRPPRLPSKSGFSRSAPLLPALGGRGQTAAERDAVLLGERLARSVRGKDLPAVQALIVARANIEHEDREGNRPAALAMLQGTPHGILKSLLEARADVHTTDGQGRSLAHLWGWSLPKSRPGVREAQKKLGILVRFKADLNTRLPTTGDTTLHVLARVFNTLSVRAAGDVVPGCEDLALGDCREAEKYAKGTQFRFQLLATSGGDVSVANGAGKLPLDLVERRFRSALPFAADRPASPDSSVSDLPPAVLKGTRRMMVSEEVPCEDRVE